MEITSGIKITMWVVGQDNVWPVSWAELRGPATMWGGGRIVSRSPGDWVQAFTTSFAPSTDWLDLTYCFNWVSDKVGKLRAIRRHQQYNSFCTHFCPIDLCKIVTIWWMRQCKQDVVEIVFSFSVLFCLSLFEFYHNKVSGIRGLQR